MILAVVEDLIFLSRIQQTAKLIGVPVEVVDPRRLQERATEAGVRAVILDLNHRSGNAVEALRALKADLSTSHLHVVGFVSHVQSDLIEAARATGNADALKTASDWVAATHLEDVTIVALLQVGK